MKRRNRVLELAGIRHRSDILLEGEEDDLFGDEGGDEGGEDEGGDEEAAEDEGGEEEEGEEEEEEIDQIPEEDIAKFGPGEIDAEVDSILKNIYDQASAAGPVDAAVALGYPGGPSGEEELDQVEEKMEESISKYTMKNFLLEDSEVAQTEVAPDEFNLRYFTSEVARYISNYDTLLDMEGMLFNKARQFLLNQFGPEMETKFIKQLALVHKLDFEQEYNEEEVPAPIAVGGNAEAAPA